MTTSIELYKWYKSKGICTKCGTNKSKPGNTMCFDCADKSNQRSQDYYHNKMSKEQYNRRLAYNKRKRELCVAFGLCRDCLKRDATKGKYCLDCYIKYTRRNKKKSELDDRFSKLVIEFNMKIGDNATRGRGRPKKQDSNNVKDIQKNLDSNKKGKTDYIPKADGVFDFEEALNPVDSLEDIMRDLLN